MNSVASLAAHHLYGSVSIQRSESERVAGGHPFGTNIADDVLHAVTNQDGTYGDVEAELNSFKYPERLSEPERKMVEMARSKFARS